MFESTTSAEFRNDFTSWRAERPAMRALIKAIKADAATDELQRLASNAGVSSSELADLRHVRRQAKAMTPQAAEYPQAKKVLSRFDAEIAALRKKAEAASVDEHPGVMAKLAQAVEMRDRHWRGNYVGPEQARKYITEVASPLGLA